MTKKILTFIVVAIASGIIGFTIGWHVADKELNETPVEIPQPDTTDTQSADTLAEWQMLQLAIAYTESKFDPSALGASNDGGILQITPIYVREVNRVTGSNYSHSDTFDIEKSLEMFNSLQDYYNPEHDTTKAIRLHNKADWYRLRVLDNLAFIRRMEAARAIVLNYE